MARAKAVPIAPASVVLKCRNCEAVAPQGTVSGTKHIGCDVKNAAQDSRYLPPAVKKEGNLVKFRPQKASDGVKVGQSEVKMAEKETAVGKGNATDNKKPVWSIPYRWNAGSADWVHIGPTCGENKKKKLHAEDVAWSKTTAHHATWIGLVQNAPPCSEKCFGNFLKLSESVAGIVFFITGDKGYCREYAEMTGEAIEPPFAIYMWKGLWSVSKAINDAPVKSPI